MVCLYVRVYKTVYSRGFAIGAWFVQPKVFLGLLAFRQSGKLCIDSMDTGNKLYNDQQRL